ncbi:hypothetical protein NUW58_g1604 [Xylaria curta]|uniref:Uncharacterized protein n=1 Tax=Xylaria curta TaxID=42375 RepID=A0ACC1PJJ2_9PEZI|nr:hypothetical protein NUW58_g1604 [Xylaria curta]
MTSLVTDLLVNPVLRQARRFSLSRSSFASDLPENGSPQRIPQACPHSQQDDAISETEEDSSLRADPRDSSSSRPSSRSSVLTSPHMNAGHVDEDSSRPSNITIPTESVISTVNSDARVSRTRGDSSYSERSNMSTAEPPSSPFMRNRSPLPEDDGMGLLRKRILEIQALEISPSDKARLMHQLLIEGYTNSQPRVQLEQPLSPTSPMSSEKRVSQSHGPLESFKFWQKMLDDAQSAEEFALTDRDLEPTFVPKEPLVGSTGSADVESDDEKLLGCEHYRRNVKKQCSACGRWYPCRFCHDKAEDHNLVRKETRNMLCLDAEAIENDLVGRSAQASDLPSLGNPDAITMDGTVRDMRRRHSSTVTGSAVVDVELNSFSIDRLARSVSPVPTPGRSLHTSMVGGYFDLEEESDGDIFGFWSRLPRSLTSNDEDDDGAESSDDMASDEEIGDDEGEESEDDDFELLGHR